MAKRSHASYVKAGKKAARTRKRNAAGKSRAGKSRRRRVYSPKRKRSRAKGKYHRPRLYKAKSGRWYRKKPGSRGRQYTFPRPTRLNPRRRRRRTYARRRPASRRRYRRNPLPSMKQLMDPKRLINGIKLGASVLGGYALVNTFNTQISSRIAAKVVPNNVEAQFWLSTVLNAMGTILIANMVRGQSSKFSDAVMAGGFFVVTRSIVSKVMPSIVPLVEGGGMSGFRQLRGFSQTRRAGGPAGVAAFSGVGGLEYDGM